MLEIKKREGDKQKGQMPLPEVQSSYRTTEKSKRKGEKKVFLEFSQLLMS